MIFAKVVTVIIAGVLTAITVRRLMSQVNAAKARVKPRQDNTVTKLRQDPSTGVYYPAD
jgi:type II secretory pathway pseudopilin PulG